MNIDAVVLVGIVASNTDLSQNYQYNDDQNAQCYKNRYSDLQALSIAAVKQNWFDTGFILG